MSSDLRKGIELANRYTLVERLGGGTHTQTWLANDRMTRAAVALKVLTSASQGSAALRSEWQTSIRLIHAHIVRVFEFHSDDGHTFYSMQHVAGADIGALSGAPVGDILPAVTLVASALQYAHSRDVVHRDIKASNILLDSHGAPFVADFGSSASTASTASGGSLIAATPQSLAGEPAQPADDVFALGGLVYELLSGRAPYGPDDIERDIRERVPPPLQPATGASLSPAVDTLLANMLAKDPARRPDAQAVVDALTAAGYAGAPAPATYVGKQQRSAAEVIEARPGVRSRPATATAAPTAGAATKGGIRPRTLGIGLAVLAALLAIVVFVLPRTVPTDPAGEGATTAATAPAASDAETGADAAADAAADEPPERDARVVARAEADTALGELLSMMRTLEQRAVQRWGGLRFKQAQELYADADAAYLERDYATAKAQYEATKVMLEPLLSEVDEVFAKTFADAQAALDAADSTEAVRLFELAVAISPGDARAQDGYSRAKNLDTVLALTERGETFERQLELDAAQQSFAQAVALDSKWQPAQDGLRRVNEQITQMDFDMRMTEGLIAIADGHYDAARAAFRMAQDLKPASQEPADGLLQVEQEIRLNQIAGYEQQALQQQADEAWPAAAATYEKLLELDPNLLFAQQGLQQAQEMTALHEQLDDYIAKPDSLSAAATMQRATTTVVNITRLPEAGPELIAKRDELSRLLKRAATPLQVQLVSDNATDVSVYKVGKLGSFDTHQLTLRPGTYVAVGSRPGYRDVRLEFRVAPELQSAPIVIRCEEPI